MKLAALFLALVLALVAQVWAANERGAGGARAMPAALRARVQRKPARDGACARALALPKQRTRQRETPRWKARRLGARRTTDAYRSPLGPPSAPRPRPATTFRASRPP